MVDEVGGVTVVNVGHVYKDEDGIEVIPFHVDFARGLVRFSAIGRSREMELPVDEFLKDYSYVGLQSAHAEKPAKATREAAVATKSNDRK